jgi:hypothetical protein
VFFERVSRTSFRGFPGQGEGQRFRPCVYLLVIGHIWRQLAGSGVQPLAIGGQDHHRWPPASLMRPSARGQACTSSACRRCAALGAVLLWRPFSDVAPSAWTSRAVCQPRSVAGRSMGVAHVAVVRRGQWIQGPGQQRSAQIAWIWHGHDLAPPRRRPVMPKVVRAHGAWRCSSAHTHAPLMAINAAVVNAEVRAPMCGPWDVRAQPDR